MGRYGLASQGLSGSGGSAGGITPTGLFPIFITSSNFTTATAYNNPNIVGQNIAIFVNEYSQQWMVAGATTFTMTSTGINITLPGFDATAFQYTILIDKLGSG
jgi:hypothetical protein